MENPYRIKKVLTLEKLRNTKVLTYTQYNALIKAIKDGKSIIVTGKMNTGKTVLLQAILQKLSKDSDITIYEECMEITLDKIVPIRVAIKDANVKTASKIIKNALQKPASTVVIGELYKAELIDAANKVLDRGLRLFGTAISIDLVLQSSKNMGNMVEVHMEHSNELRYAKSIVDYTDNTKIERL